MSNSISPTLFISSSPSPIIVHLLLLLHLTPLLLSQFLLASPLPKTRMGKTKVNSDVLCWCGKKTVEFVSYTEKNPGRRFLKCDGIGRKCRFWVWVDEPLPPLVRSAIDLNSNKGEKTIRFLTCCVVILCIIFFVVFRYGNGECNCSCNCNK